MLNFFCYLNNEDGEDQAWENKNNAMSEKGTGLKIVGDFLSLYPGSQSLSNNAMAMFWLIGWQWLISHSLSQIVSIYNIFLV